jgi:hypothetical protein
MIKGNEMNAKQAKVIETVTKKSWVEWKFCTSIDGELEFRIEEIGNKVFLFGSNTGSKSLWDKGVAVQMFIGSLGGISKLKLIK